MNPQDEPDIARASKTLAAIVFTDVEGFSRHSNVDEARALANFQRDLRIITEVCERHNGVVLKTMGDGALMRFKSADNALSCALEIQRVLYEQSLRLDHRDVLAHRIGVHLGDIMTSATDVFGDGVNVAARLQAEAKPGAIMLSRTVYDVVKGKVKFKANPLGPRQLKGIKEPIALWEVPSLHQQLVDRRNASLDGMLPEEMRNPSSTGVGGLRGLPAAIVGVGSFVLLVIGAVIMVKTMQGARTQMDRSAAARLARPAASIPVKVKPASQSDAGTESGSSAAGTVDVDPLQDPALVKDLAALFESSDFAGMATLVTNRYGTGPKAAALAKKYTNLAAYVDWLSSRLAEATDASPVKVESDPDSGGSAMYFTDPTGHLVRKTDTTQSFVQLGQLSKAALTNLGQAALQAPHAPEPLSKDDITADIQAIQDESARFDVKSVAGSGSGSGTNSGN